MQHSPKKAELSEQIFQSVLYFAHFTPIVCNKSNYQQPVENLSKYFRLNIVGNCGELCNFTH